MTILTSLVSKQLCQRRCPKQRQLCWISTKDVVIILKTDFYEDPSYQMVILNQNIQLFYRSFSFIALTEDFQLHVDITLSQILTPALTSFLNKSTSLHPNQSQPILRPSTTNPFPFLQYSQTTFFLFTRIFTYRKIWDRNLRKKKRKSKRI